MADPKPAPKIMDVVHPGNVQPSPSGRPVIVSNHSYIKADPMLSASDDAQVSGSATAPQAAAEPVAEMRREKVISEPKPAAEAEPEKPIEPKEPPTQEKDVPAGGATGKPAAVPDKEAVTDPATEDASSDATSNVLLQSTQGQNPEEAAAQEREDELEQLIASGQYAVPINVSGKRKGKMVLLIVATLLLVLVAVNLLADMQVITLPSGIPHTSFFAP